MTDHSPLPSGTLFAPPTAQEDTRNYPARVLISHEAIAHNLRVLRKAAPTSKQMVIIKANAYGHDLVPVALTALRCGADYLGVAQVPEALTLRAALDEAGVPRQQARIFTWIGYEGTDWRAPLAADLDVSASSVERLADICAAVRALRDDDSRGHRPPAEQTSDSPVVARVHLKIDTGMGRAGARLEGIPALAAAARMAVDEGLIEVVGVWSHLHSADDLSANGRAATAAQRDMFELGLEILAQVGIEPPLRHIAATAGILWHPECHYDMVRPGIGVCGLSPAPATASEADLNFVPAMTITAPLTMVKRLQAGDGVSYGHTWQAPEPTWVGLVPLGYADGVLRSVSNIGSVWVPGLDKSTAPGVQRAQIIGRVCMDQFLINLGPAEGPAPARVGDRVVLFSTGEHGEPTASDWAGWASTINYEIVARIGDRLPRIHVLPADWAHADHGDNWTSHGITA